MDKSRKPEWTPSDAGSEFAGRIIPAQAGITKKPATYHKAPKLSTEDLFNGVLAGDRTALAKAITIIESNSSKHFEQGQELIKKLLPHSSKSIRIGITGTPGVGKSTFIEAFGVWLADQDKKVAVLAIDPSSTLSRGSVLGDKTRMEKLSAHPNSFIRPSPSSGVLGGVARKTRESIILCEAAGFEVILIETVGVGQSETEVRSMVDFFLLMQIAGAGDELQGIKKGIMELADLLVVNKADGDNVLRAQHTLTELNNALHYLRPSTPGWTTRALSCSSITREGIPQIWEKIQDFCSFVKSNGYFEERRKSQVSRWFDSLLQEAILARYYGDPSFKAAIDKAKQDVESAKIPAVKAVDELLKP